ncbi:hypothetical protein Pfo_013470, partial [Paulownia fortunei]
WTSMILMETMRDLTLTANPILRAINLKSVNLITAWIDYVNERKKVEVYLSIPVLSQESHSLLWTFDLSDYLKKFVSAVLGSTKGSTELLYIENWSFQIRGFRPLGQELIL